MSTLTNRGSMFDCYYSPENSVFELVNEAIFPSRSLLRSRNEIKIDESSKYVYVDNNNIT